MPNRKTTGGSKLDDKVEAEKEGETKVGKAGLAARDCDCLGNGPPGLGKQCLHWLPRSLLTGMKEEANCWRLESLE